MPAVITQYPVIGELRETGTFSPFGTFDTRAVRGLARVTDDGRRLELLAIVAWRPGRGAGTRFLDNCVACYDVVRVLEIMNARFAGWLERRGFRPGVWWIDGEQSSGMEWRREWRRAAVAPEGR